MPEIMRITDANNGFARIDVIPRAAGDTRRAPIMFRAVEWGYAIDVALSRATIDRLRALLAPYGTHPDSQAFKIGDRARVTGDTANWHHEFADGTVVTLLDETDNYGGARGGRGGWHCRAADGEEWNVHTSDLEPATLVASEVADQGADSGPLDPRRVAAMREAFALLGGEGHTVDVDALAVVADFLAGGA